MNLLFIDFLVIYAIRHDTFPFFTTKGKTIMKLSLRKAHKLVSAVNKRIVELESDLSLITMFVEHKNITDVRDVSRVNFISQEKLFLTLTFTIHEIRTAINIGNSAEITPLLAKKAYLEKIISFYVKLLADTKGAEPYDHSSLDNLRNIRISSREKSGGGFPFTHNALFVDENQLKDIQTALKNYQKLLSSIEESIEELNHSTKIQLNDDIVEVLSELNI